MQSDADTLRPAKKRRAAEDLEAPHSDWVPIRADDVEDIAFDYGEVQQIEVGDKRKRNVRPPLTAAGSR